MNLNPEGVDLDRRATIYGIRDKATGDIRYVGCTVHYEQRKRGRYGKKVEIWKASCETEHFIIEDTTVEHASDRERHHIARLRENGAKLLNKFDPVRNRSLPMDEQTRRWYAHRAATHPTRLGVKESRSGQWLEWRETADAMGMRLEDWVRMVLDQAAGARFAADTKDYS